MNKPRLSFWQIWNMSFGFLGIQFGWGLQMANMSAIYKYLGAADHEIAWLWIAAPLTGLLIQPIVGQMSDRCWTGLGRRRPFILVGAILASLSLILMPNSPTLWMAAGLLWVLDGSINASMQPFRALVADNTPEEQNSQGFAMQSLFIGLGGTVSSALPWMMTNWFGVPVEQAGGGHIPASVKLSFYIGAVAFLAAVVYTVLTTREYPPSDKELAEIRSRKFDWSLGLGEIAGLVMRIPRRMWELGVVQFFTWIGLFCMWIYFSPAVAKRLYQATPDSPEFAVALLFFLCPDPPHQAVQRQACSCCLSVGRSRRARFRPGGERQIRSPSLHGRRRHRLGQHPFHALRHGQHISTQRKYGGLHGHL